MEFVVIVGGSVEATPALTDNCRAHGFQAFDPRLYFTDAVGDVRINAKNMRQAEVWCEHQAMVEVKRHKNIVVTGVYVNPTLLKLAEQEGYRVTLIRLDHSHTAVSLAQLEAILTSSGSTASGWLQKIFRRF